LQKKSSLCYLPWLQNTGKLLSRALVIKFVRSKFVLDEMICTKMCRMAIIIYLWTLYFCLLSVYMNKTSDDEDEKLVFVSLFVCLFLCVFIASRAIFQLFGGSHHLRLQDCKIKPILLTFSSEGSFTYICWDKGFLFIISHPKDKWFSF
jgi:hypothetical protein